MGRSSTLLAHPNIAEIQRGLAESAPIALLAKQYGVSESALYRLRSSRFGKAALKASEKAALQKAAEDVRVIDYIDAAADSLRDADAVRRQGMVTGNTNLVLKASLVIERLTRLLALRLGVDGSNTARMLSDGDAVVTALAQVIRQTPGVAEDMIYQLNLAGQRDVADEFTDFAKSLANTNSTKEIE